MEVVAGIILIIGLLILSSGPKPDKRYKTGYMNNSTPPSLFVYFIGLVLTVCGGGGIYYLNRITPNDDVSKADGVAIENKNTTEYLDENSLHYNNIYFVQSHLKRLGYNTGKIDGLFGLKTKAAIEKYQIDNNLSVTGSADEELISSIKNNHPR